MQKNDLVIRCATILNDIEVDNLNDYKNNLFHSDDPNNWVKSMKEVITAGFVREEDGKVFIPAGTKINITAYDPGRGYTFKVVGTKLECCTHSGFWVSGFDEGNFNPIKDNRIPIKIYDLSAYLDELQVNDEVIVWNIQDFAIIAEFLVEHDTSFTVKPTKEHYFKIVRR